LSCNFANKDELVEQVLIAVSLASAETLPEAMAAAGTARGKLRAIVESLVGFMASHRTYTLAALETWNMTRSLPGRLRDGRDGPPGHRRGQPGVRTRSEGRPDSLRRRANGDVRSSNEGES
jgi:hypothetical protein